MTTTCMTTVGASALLIAFTCSCPSARAPQPAPPFTAPPPVSAPAAAPAPDVPTHSDTLGPAEQQFLVHLESQEVVLLSMAGEGKRVLVPHANASLYQPALELIWFRHEDRFGVVDLRKPGAPAIWLGHGMPDEHRLSVERGMEVVAPNDGCDLPFVALEWSESPALTAYLTEAPPLGIDNQAWFAAELERPARARTKKQGFIGAAVRLPKKLTGCDLPQACGKSAPFGADGKQLVLVVERTGGDCVVRACLLYDPSSRLFATPPKARKWAAAQETAPGTCGPYLFDASKSAFLVDHRLCTLEQGCRDLGGEALGWLIPGAKVGEPGTGNFAEE